MSSTSMLREHRVGTVGVGAAACVALLVGCAPSAERAGSEPSTSASPTSSAVIEIPTPGADWQTIVYEPFDDPVAAAPWIFKGPPDPVIEDGAMSYPGVAGWAGYTDIPRSLGLGDLESVRITVNVTLVGMSGYGASCHDRFDHGAYRSPDLYRLAATTSGSTIEKITDDESPVELAHGVGSIPDPFTGEIRLTCLATDEGYYLEVAVDGKTTVQAIDTELPAIGTHARLYEATTADRKADHGVAILDVRVESPAP
ncbi:hypothetical protein [Microbacterium pumilum]|uniref:Uncharacterized protein n=1 Tax=Microbacterium pumilum TaxID=344165 RepID=A0ABN2RSX8_9MICO